MAIPTGEVLALGVSGVVYAGFFFACARRRHWGAAVFGAGITGGLYWLGFMA